LVLLTAAGLKLYGLQASAVPQVGWLAHPSIQSAAVVVELLLGGWLLAGVVPRLAWAATVVTFGTFAVLSGLAAVNGQPTCNCFGPLAVSPWWVFGLDATILAALLTWRAPATASAARHPPIVLMIASATVAGWQLPTLYARVAAWAVGTVAVDGPTWLSEMPAGATTTHDITVRNHGRSTVHIVGGSADCSHHWTGLPTALPPGDATLITFVIRAPRDAAGTYFRQVQLYTDRPEQPRLSLPVGFVVAPHTADRGEPEFAATGGPGK
jgi:hypothetical protein